MGIQAIRQNNGAQAIGRFLGFGTQRTAAALKGTLSTVSKVGGAIGAFGYELQAVSIGSKLYNGESISTADAVGWCMGYDAPTSNTSKEGGLCLHVHLQ